LHACNTQLSRARQWHNQPHDQRRNHSAQWPFLQAKTFAFNCIITMSDTSASTDPRKDSLIEYPSLFPIKVMGLHADDLVHNITKLAKEFDPFFDATTVELRPSSTGKYLGVTITVTATSREQLDDLYRALTSHPMVKVVL
jgi:putative lipoic acid-binding regulatory protein